MSAGESRRRELIPAIRDMIVKGVPGAESAIQETIDAWRDGLAPASPWAAGVYQVCEKIAADIDAQAEAEERHPSRGTLADAQDAREFYEREDDGGES